LPPKSPIQSNILIEAESSGHDDSHLSPHSPHIIHDEPSSLSHAVEAKIATQHGLVNDSNQEFLDTEISPLINVLPELEYPVMDSPVAEVEGSEMCVDEVDPEKEDERDERVSMSAEVIMIDQDEGVVEELAANDMLKKEIGVLRECVDEVDKSVMQHLRLDEGEVHVDLDKTPEPIQFREKGGEEDKEEGEVEKDCPSSVPSPKVQVDPCRRSPGTPKSTHQPSIPQFLDQTNIDLSSLHSPSEEAVPMIAQFATLPDSESESEVDELAPSEPHDFQKDLEEESTEGACTMAKDQTVAVESSFQQENDSIHSSETIGQGVGNVDEEELEYAEMRADEPLLERGADHTFLAQSYPVRQSEHLHLQPTPVVSPDEVILNILPDDAYPMTTPSPGRFPTLSSVLGTRGGLSRKRKFEEINVGDTVEQSNLGSESQTLRDRIRSTKDASPSIADCRQGYILQIPRGVSESDISRSRKKDEIQEGSPIYISSGSSSPTSNKFKATRNDIALEWIDLTDNLPLVGLVDVTKQKNGPSPSNQAPSTTEIQETLKARRKRGKRRPRGWEKLKKRIAMVKAEKEIVDLGADASDEPDIRPVRRLELSNGAAEQASGDTNSANGPTTMPTIDFAAIRTRQEQNEKKSKASTRIRRRQRVNTNQSGSVNPGLIGKGDSDSDRPSKKTRTEPRDVDVKPVILGVSSKQKKLAIRGKPLNIAQKTATNQMQQLRTVDKACGVPSSSNRVKWPLKKTGERHDKNVSTIKFLLPGIDLCC